MSLCVQVESSQGSWVFSFFCPLIGLLLLYSSSCLSPLHFCLLSHVFFAAHTKCNYLKKTTASSFIIFTYTWMHASYSYSYTNMISFGRYWLIECVRTAQHISHWINIYQFDIYLLPLYTNFGRLQLCEKRSHFIQKGDSNKHTQHTKLFFLLSPNSLDWFQQQQRTANITNKISKPTKFPNVFAQACRAHLATDKKTIHKLAEPTEWISKLKNSDRQEKKRCVIRR